MAKNPLKKNREKKDKLTLGDIWPLRMTLKRILTQQMEAKAAYALAKLARTFDKEFSAIEAARIALVEKHGAKFKKEDGGITIPEGSPEWNSFQEEFQELLDQESDISFEGLNIDHLSSIRISPDEMSKLSPYIE